MGYTPLAALIGFILVNVVSYTPFRLGEFQTAILMLLSWLAATKLLGNHFPELFKQDGHESTITVTSSRPVDTIQGSTSDVPVWGTPEYALSNSRAGQGE